MPTVTQEVHVDDIGTAFEVTLQDDAGIVDLTGYISLEYDFTDPAGTVTTKTASPLTDGTDGKIVYLTQAGDLPTAGLWRFQAKIVLPTGSWSSTIQKFKVYPNLD